MDQASVMNSSGDMDEEMTFSQGAKDGAEARFPEGTLDFFQAGDFTINCTSVSLLDQIAKGSYGTVYKGSMNGTTCAVKIEDFHEEDEEQVNILVELSMLQSFPHMNLVRFHGAGYLPKSATGEKVCMFHNLRLFALNGLLIILL